MEKPRQRIRVLAETVARRTTGPVGSIREVRTSSQAVVLTYDDGPEPQSTEAILAELSRAGATATFFVLLTKCRQEPALVRRIIDQGSEVALHGPDHRRLTEMDWRAVLSRTSAAKRELEDLAGRPVRWIRPPYGAQRLSTYVALRRAGLMPVMWSGTLWDWRDLPDSQRLEKALTTIRPGVILLGHDGFPGVEDGAPDRLRPRFDRGALARGLLVGLGERGLQGCSLERSLVGAHALRWAWFGG